MIISSFNTARWTAEPEGPTGVPSSSKISTEYARLSKTPTVETSVVVIDESIVEIVLQVTVAEEPAAGSPMYA